MVKFARIIFMTTLFMSILAFSFCAAPAYSLDAKDEKMSELLNDLLSSVPEGRANAVSELASIGASAVKPMVIFAAKGRANYDAVMIDVLNRIGTPAIDALMELYEDDSIGARRTALTLLSAVNDRRVLKLLMTVVKNSEENWTIRQEAFRSLSMNYSDYPETLEFCLELLDWSLEPSNQISYWNVSYLGHYLKEKRAVEPLIASMLKNPYQSRMYVAGALANLGDKRAVQPIITLLKDKDDQVLYAAIQALGKLGDVAAVEPLISVLRDKGSNGRVLAAESLGKLGDKRAVKPLMGVLNNDDKKFRYNVVKALGELKAVEALDQLIAIMKEPNPETKKEVNPSMRFVARLDINRAAFEALGKIGDKRAVEPLEDMYYDEDSCNKVYAAAALYKITGDEDALEFVIRATRHVDESIKKCAVNALSALKAPESVDALLALLDDDDNELRTIVIKTLGEIKDPRSVEPLIRTSRYKKSYVGMEALRAFTKINDPRVVDILLSKLEDEAFENTRMFIAVALGDIGDKSAIAPLEKRLGKTFVIGHGVIRRVIKKIKEKR